jgi:hypothetical protein
MAQGINENRYNQGMARHAPTIDFCPCFAEMLYACGNLFG